MTKFIYVVMCVMAASLSEVSALTNKERSILFEIAAPSLIECGAEFSVSQTDIQKASKANSADAFVPCFLACLFRKHDFLNNNGLFTAEKGMAELKRRVGSQVDLTPYNEISQKCSKANDEVVNDNEAGCDRAMLVMTCAIESNVELPF